ncbi:hypothetical protein ACM44_09520 [Chryseobacterium koreense CCUG 49689]|uniref:Uncharacterized protein n=1 Tax=Chryseobacterium koreense CCUG 49689 TaxID=1304281 RepID=A0A0J7IXY5_9FLAO|nr:hypothetical protein ACM44_09520 [Chryseobacterium koreense CCUG 49689]
MNRFVVRNFHHLFPIFLGVEFFSKNIFQPVQFRQILKDFNIQLHFFLMVSFLVMMKLPIVSFSLSEWVNTA